MRFPKTAKPAGSNTVIAAPDHLSIAPKILKPTAAAEAESGKANVSFPWHVRKPCDDLPAGCQRRPGPLRRSKPPPAEGQRQCGQVRPSPDRTMAAKPAPNVIAEAPAPGCQCAGLQEHRRATAPHWAEAATNCSQRPNAPPAANTTAPTRLLSLLRENDTNRRRCIAVQATKWHQYRFHSCPVYPCQRQCVVPDSSPEAQEGLVQFRQST